ncbi:MAG: hypothetical protein NZ750_07625 [Anaerolineae bacterium]|nr:hypothetical protein [Anaerolineae bacterium]MDW8172218.1 hypothetical protein [Anaerolineae bacterium]
MSAQALPPEVLIDWQRRRWRRTSARPVLALRVALLSSALVLGWAYAQADYLHGGGSSSERLWRGLYFPLVAWGWWTSLLALVSGADLRQDRPTWDALRASERGVLLTLRAYWLAGFGRLRFELSVALLGRLALLMGLLVELASLRGGYLNILAGGLIPPAPQSLAFACVVLALAAALALPMASTGLEMALGLLIARSVRPSWLRDLAYLSALGLRFSLGVAGLLAFARLPALPSSGDVEQVVVAVIGALTFGDGGLLAFSLSQSAQVWGLLTHGLALSLLWLGLLLAQALLSDLLLALAVRAAQRAE